MRRRSFSVLGTDRKRTVVGNSVVEAATKALASTKARQVTLEETTSYDAAFSYRPSTKRLASATAVQRAAIVANRPPAEERLPTEFVVKEVGPSRPVTRAFAVVVFKARDHESVFVKAADAAAAARAAAAASRFKGAPLLLVDVKAMTTSHYVIRARENFPV